MQRSRRRSNGRTSYKSQHEIELHYLKGSGKIEWSFLIFIVFALVENIN